jgi:hypothetical protein
VIPRSHPDNPQPSPVKWRRRSGDIPDIRQAAEFFVDMEVADGPPTDQAAGSGEVATAPADGLAATGPREPKATPSGGVWGASFGLASPVRAQEGQRGLGSPLWHAERAAPSFGQGAGGRAHGLGSQDVQGLGAALRGLQ